MALEEAIREAHARGDFVTATTETLRGYGPEVLGLLVALHRDHDDAADAFAIFSEKVWSSLPKFEWRCSMRTWAYTLARRASRDLRRGDRRRKQHDVPLENPAVAHVAALVRTKTLALYKTENKTEIVRLRESLPDEDQTLLILRVDRDLAWNDLAVIFLEQSEQVIDAVAIRREAARLRKRFQLVKERLLKLARERGLFTDQDS